VRQPCVAGTHTTAAATASSDLVCAQCNAGEHQMLAGQDACVKCGAGKYRNAAPASSSEALACTACAVGHFQGSESQMSCTECEAGTFQPSTGQPKCEQCAAGQYQDAKRATGCDKCDAGSFQGAAGQASCVACDGFHYFQDTAGKAACKLARVCEKTSYQTKATTTTSNRECLQHTNCKRPEWEVKYEGTHHDRECAIAQVCQHTHCALHDGKIRVQHHKKDHLSGFTHHHCKFDALEQKCVCLCHNKKVDDEFAYNPKDRFFWRKKTETHAVRRPIGNGCAGALYSPSGASTPSTLELCRADSVGRKVLVSAGLPFAEMTSSQLGQADSIVTFANDRLSFQGQESQCNGAAVEMSTTTESVTVYECVQATCPHPLCCDCGNEFCSRGHASGACADKSSWLDATPGQSYTPAPTALYHPLDEPFKTSLDPTPEAERTSGAPPDHPVTKYPRNPASVSP
jgi:hypothetical protein